MLLRMRCMARPLESASSASEFCWYPEQRFPGVAASFAKLLRCSAFYWLGRFGRRATRQEVSFPRLPLVFPPLGCWSTFSGRQPTPSAARYMISSAELSSDEHTSVAECTSVAERTRPGCDSGALRTRCDRTAARTPLDLSRHAPARSLEPPRVAIDGARHGSHHGARPRREKLLATSSYFSLWIRPSAGRIATRNPSFGRRSSFSVDSSFQ